MLLNLVLDREAPAALGQQIYLHVREQIQNGILAPGQRLETSRRLAQHLGCSRNVVLDAIDNLVADGLLCSAPRSSVHVAHDISRPTQSIRHSKLLPLGELQLSTSGRLFLDKVPCRSRRAAGSFAASAFPYAAWSKVYRKVWKDNRLDPYAADVGQGDPGLLEALAAYIQVTRGISCGPENLILFETEALACSAIASVLLDHGDAVWMEVPGFCRISEPLRVAGSRVVPVPAGPHGLDIRQAEALGPTARLAVTSAPWCSLASRGVNRSTAQRLIDWASAENGWILERGCHGDIRQRSSDVPSMKATDAEGRVLHLGSLAPALLPDLSIAFVVGRPDIIQLLATAKRVLQGPLSYHFQPVLKEFINGGHFSRNAMKVMRACDRQQSAILNLAERLLGHVLAEPARRVGNLLVLELACPPWPQQTADLARLLAGFCGSVRGASSLVDQLDGRHSKQGLLLDCLEVDLAAVQRQLPILAGAIDELVRSENPAGPTTATDEMAGGLDLFPAVPPRLRQLVV